MNRLRLKLLTSIVLLSVSAVLLAACGSAAASAKPTQAPAAPAAAATNAPAGAMVTLKVGKNDKLGSFLTDGDGRTLYVFQKDTANTSNCNGACAQNWPALIASGQPAAGDGVTGSLIGTTARSDGSKQVTYSGRPLYHYAGDKNPGDTAGQGIGGVWSVVSPSGQPMLSAPGGSGPASPTNTPSSGGGYGGSAQSSAGGKNDYNDTGY